MENRINTINEKTINETLKTGQVIRNGNMRLFRIAGVFEKLIALQSLNGETEKLTYIPRNTFVKLYFRKNYDQVLTNNPLKEAMEAKSVGATRFLIK